MEVDPDQTLIDEVDREIINQSPPEEGIHSPRNDNEDAARGEYLRDSITASMWTDYARNSV